jgi:hypothetical protein
MRPSRISTEPVPGRFEIDDGVGRDIGDVDVGSQRRDQELLQHFDVAGPHIGNPRAGQLDHHALHVEMSRQLVYHLAIGLAGHDQLGGFDQHQRGASRKAVAGLVDQLGGGAVAVLGADLAEHFEAGIDR